MEDKPTAEIVLVGPAYRADSTGPVETDDGRHLEAVAVRGTYNVEHRLEEPTPNFGYYLAEPAISLASATMNGDAEDGAEWTLAGAEPSAWDATVYPTAEFIAESARLAAAEQEGAGPADVVLEWAELPRCPRPEALSAFQTLAADQEAAA